MVAFSRSVLEEEPLRPGASPTAAQVRAMGTLGIAFGPTGRVAAINDIGVNLCVPRGAWPKAQAKLFVGGDINLYRPNGGVFGLMTRATAAKHIAANLASVARSCRANVLLTMVTAQREHATSITASGEKMVDSFWEGGLDHLWTSKDHLGLPKAITSAWKEIKPYFNPDFHPGHGRVPHKVHPALIPARDQTVAYGGQIGTSFDGFKSIVGRLLGADAGSAISRLSRIGRLVWQAYAFLAPGGNPFDPKQSLGSQIHQGFGIVTALGYIVSTAGAGNPAVDLDRVFLDEALNHSAWIQSAKVRTVETLFLERLFAAVSQLTLVDQ
jgi:hypothetical protein